uniref:Uncharacterized protein n=1 Tax=Arundo donax TaxID=35708 RepID=A0A0A9D3L1_ARUDO
MHQNSSTAQKLGNDLDLRLRLCTCRAQEMETVPLPLRFPGLHLAAPPIFLQLLTIQPTSAPHRVLPPDAHQHALAPQTGEAGRALRHRVDPRVVAPARPRAHHRPQPDQLAEQRHAHLVRLGAVASQEVRMDQHERVHLHAVAQLLGAGAHRGVVRDVGARALPAEVDAPEVRVRGQPGLRPLLARGVRGHPLERRPRVPEERGDRVLGREAVLHRHDDGAGPRGEPVGVAVHRGVERRAEAEPAPVEEHQDRELAAGGRGGRREVYARREAGVREDGDVLGGDACGGVGGGQGEVDWEEALGAAALVHADEAGGVVDDLVAAGHGGPEIGI